MPQKRPPKSLMKPECHRILNSVILLTWCWPFQMFQSLSQQKDVILSLRSVIVLFHYRVLKDEANHKTWLWWPMHLARELELSLPAAWPPKLPMPEWADEIWGIGELMFEDGSDSGAEGDCGSLRHALCDTLEVCSVCTAVLMLGFGLWKPVQSRSWPPEITALAVAEEDTVF